MSSNAGDLVRMESQEGSPSVAGCEQGPAAGSGVQREASDARSSVRALLPAIIMCAGAALAVAAILCSGGPAPAVESIPMVEPELIALPTECGPDQPLFRAREALEEAAARSERYAFAAGDGVEAVALFRRAELCLRAAGYEDAAAASRLQRERLAVRLQRDFRLHRLRLDRALGANDEIEALREVRALSALLRHRTDSEFYTRLKALELSLDAVGEE